MSSPIKLTNGIKSDIVLAIGNILSHAKHPNAELNTLKNELRTLLSQKKETKRGGIFLEKCSISL